jgi:alkanesulfonate monooxygenase SsuD/methylene tetrahydromethanopterin reductase-like flavin-dependent oxidoreductase (luciferase family)
MLRSKIDILHRHCAAVGRDPESVEITVLDLPVIGTDREDAAVRVERLRGRLPAAVYAARHHAAPAVDHAQRYRELADLGVSTVFVALPDLTGADDLARCIPLLAALHRG